MSFLETLKLEIKRKAAFRCCRCHEIGIDVHHIVPQSCGGLDTADNAAPLCQNCHDRFGDNPQKRKEIRQMRDWWYEVVEERFAGHDDYLRRLEELDQSIQAYSKENAVLLQKIAGNIETLVTSEKPNAGDTRDTVRRKITRTIDFGPFHVRKRISCPFCHKDLTLELSEEMPELLLDSHYPTSQYSIMLAGLAKQSPFGHVRETLVKCPYCDKAFNIENAGS